MQLLVSVPRLHFVSVVSKPEAVKRRRRTIYQYNRFMWYRQTFLKKFKITVDRCSTIVYYITRARHKRAHKHNKCDSGVVGNARPCQGRDRGFEPRLSLFIKRYPSWISLFRYMSVAEPLTRGAASCLRSTPVGAEQTSPGRLAPVYRSYNEKGL